MILNYYNHEFSDVSVFIGGSKSESNRALMITVYGNLKNNIENLSESDDTQLLVENLKKIRTASADSEDTTSIYCANAATVARFLLTYLSSRQGKWLLFGDVRMHQRSVKPLVDALRELGAMITYQKQDGFLPVSISGRKIFGGDVRIDACLSSQYVSSMLLAAPTFEKGLHLKIDGHVSSQPYIEMTIRMLDAFGVQVERRENEIIIPKTTYQEHEFLVESDWSSASYWYELVAFTKNSSLLLEGLYLDSLQGDAILAELFEQFGVFSEQQKQGVLIKKQKETNRRIEFDFRYYPDLFPAVAATCAGLGLEAHLSGLDNLFAKETDRKQAMQTELSKLNVLFIGSDTEIHARQSNILPYFLEKNPLRFETYNDHRIAMALAPLSLKIGAIKIQSPEIVSKSYPKFWQQLARVFQCDY